MKKIAIIGSSGSIGKQTLNVCRRHPDKFKVVSLAVGNSHGDFKSQVNEFKPMVATIASESGYNLVKGQIYEKTQTYCGENAFTDAIIEQADLVVIALVGFKGIIAVLDAIKKGKNIALANKESLVVGGELVMQEAKKKGVKIVPIDSEHSAVWQALNFDFDADFRKIILTASGGAFRDLEKSQLENVTAKDALLHPNWDMGAKITIDCATMVNKAFEVIEAKWLYNTTFDKIDVIIHRESIIHSMVEHNDGSCIAQMSYPSMEIPITLALSYPNRIDAGVKSLDFKSLATLTFKELDKDKYPCFDLILQAAKFGGGYPALANGANEQAVKLFLQGKIKFNDIYKAIYGALQSIDPGHHVHYEELEYLDTFARDYVNKLFGE